MRVEEHTTAPPLDAVDEALMQFVLAVLEDGHGAVEPISDLIGFATAMSMRYLTPEQQRAMAVKLLVAAGVLGARLN